jgi:hypothetical protein
VNDLFKVAQERVWAIVPADVTNEGLVSVSFVKYLPDGSIISFGSMARVLFDIHEDVEGSYLEGIGDIRTHWVEFSDKGVPAIRDKEPSTAVVEGMNITGLPNPSTVTVRGVTTVITDGTAEFEFGQPGDYEVLVQTLTQLDNTLTVTQNG